MKLEDQLIVADSIEHLKKLEDHIFDHCITDPPYNISGYDHKKKIGWLKSNTTWESKKKFIKIDEKWDSFSNNDYFDFCLEFIIELTRVVKINGNIIIFGSYHNIYKLGFIIEMLGLKIVNSLVWYKRNAFPNVTQRMFCESTEQMIWAVNNNTKKAKNWTFNYSELKKLTENGKQMRNMWDIPMTPLNEKEFGKHPSQKPLQVMDRLIIGCTNNGDLVLDPFCGSGSTLVSAKNNNRHFYGIDSNNEYVKLAQKRLGGSRKQKSLL
jgi:site-specific DNA-methyltransferase (adenine-specific)